MNRAFICHPKHDCVTSESDEINIYCLETEKTMFMRDENKFIYFYQICNHIKDCNDDSDENGCGNIFQFIPKFLSLGFQFQSTKALQKIKSTKKCFLNNYSFYYEKRILQKVGN